MFINLHPVPISRSPRRPSLILINLDCRRIFAKSMKFNLKLDKVPKIISDLKGMDPAEQIKELDKLYSVCPLFPSLKSPVHNPCKGPSGTKLAKCRAFQGPGRIVQWNRAASNRDHDLQWCLLRQFLECQQPCSGFAGKIRWKTRGPQRSSRRFKIGIKTGVGESERTVDT